jgi:hypothetical protein
MPLTRLTSESGRESDDYASPSLIIFKGAAVQVGWTNSKAFHGTLYGAPKNGWMEEPQFFHWFANGFITHVLN